MTSSYHDSYRRTVRDLPILGQPVYQFLLQRRFLCHQCEKPFNETFKAVDVQQRQTLRLQRRLIEASRNSSIADCSRREKIGYRIKVPPEAKERLKAIRKILSKPYDELSMEEQQELKALLAEHLELRRVHRLTEYIRHWYRTDDIHKARQRLGYWLRQVELSGIPEFQELAKMMRRWRKSTLKRLV